MLKTIRRFIERGRKGYCKEDLWNWDKFFSDLMVRSLKEFKLNCHGYPNDIDEWEDWMKILDEMIECFEEQNRRIDNISGGNFMERYKKREQVKTQKLHRGLELLEKYYYDLWD